MQVKHSGTWKNATPACKVGGSWVTPKEVWVKDAGMWKKEWSSYLYETAITCGVNAGSSPPSSWSYKGFEGDGLSYTLISGGAVAPADVGGHAVLTAFIYVGYNNGTPNDSNLNLRLSVPVGASGPWLSIRAVTAAGVTIPGRFQREYDSKNNAALASVFFCVRATSNDLGTANYDTPALTAEEKAALIALHTPLSQGGVFRVQFS